MLFSLLGRGNKAFYRDCPGKESEVEMTQTISKLEKCSVCKEEYTSTHVEAVAEMLVYVCENCLEAAKYNFIFICMGCGKVYLRPKKLVINRINNPELKRAYLLCEDMQIIQGIDMCIGCDPEGIMNYVNNKKMKAEC